MKARIRFSLLGLAAVICAAQPTTILAAETAKPAKELSFGIIQGPTLEQARGQALDWLKSVKNDPAALKQFDAIWANENLSQLDKVSETLILGSADAAKLLNEARTPEVPAPKEVPALLRDQKANAFFRNNLALAYGKALANRRIHEDALEVLNKNVKVDQVVDPAALYFHKAIAEHALLNKEEATRSINKVYECADAAERYKMVALLMQLDMETWQEKGLTRIGQLMGTVERRLDVARGGPHTQKIEAEIVKRLDEEIKKIENQAKGSGSGNGEGCPSGAPKDGGGKPGDNVQSSSPQKDSMGGNGKGPGKIDPKDYKGDPLQLGTLPEVERAKALQRKLAELPPEKRQLIEAYYRKVAGESTNK